MTAENIHQESGFERYRVVLIYIFLSLAILFVYWQVQYFSFIDFDDNMYIIENPHVQSGLSYHNLIWAFTTTHTTNWHPLTWLSLMFDYDLYRLNPSGYHWTNTLFHIVNTLLLFFVFNRMTGETWKSALVAFLFAVHPMNVESVAWIAERKNVLSTSFWALTMLTYVLYVESPVLKRYLLVLLSFTMGLMVKSMLVTLPFVLLLLDYWPLNRFPSAMQGSRDGIRWSEIFPLIREKLPLLVLACVSSIVTVYVARSGGAIKSLDTFPLNVRITNAFVSYMMYLKKMVWPQNLAIFYPHEEMISLWKIVPACLIILGFTIFVLFMSRRYRYLPVGWFWYIGTLIPVIGLIQVGYQAMADRYAYVPLIGIFVIISWGVSDIFLRFFARRILLILLAATVVSASIVASWQQVQYWQSSMTIFQHALNVTKNNYQAHQGVGNVLLYRGDIDGAIAHYMEALRFKPDHALVRNNLGMALMYRGKFEEAKNQYIEALRIKPNQAKVYNNMGVLLAKQGKRESAIAYFREALRIDPDCTSAKGNLQVALQVQENSTRLQHR
ncbi:MAG: tetratricopeptide repeat protein [Syntrophales bacterium]